MNTLPLVVLVGLATLTAIDGARAQFPDRPVRIIVTTAPGGGPDVAARLLSDKLSGSLRQPVVIENKTGANGNIAGDYVARSTPDGYTLLVAPDSLMTVNPHVYSKLSFDVLKDFVAVAGIYQNSFTLTVHPSVPAKTFPEFVAYARQTDPPLRYATAGLGSVHHLGIEMLKQRAAIDLAPVHYRGGALAGRATVAGETHVVLSGVGVAGLIRSGKLRALATTGARRSTLFPDLLPISHFYPGYDLTAWTGLFAPAGTPKPVVTRLRTEVQMALADPDFVQKLGKVGPEPLILSAQDFDAWIRRYYEQYGKVVKAIDLKIE